ncbi:thaumatin family-domain-containing protein [Daedaleopsis nitida]|nr:thaumatin family-domain-containing protein [Daedaleopsis nitida]
MQRTFAALTVFLFIFACDHATAARTFTVKNNCDFTIWPALSTDKSSPSKPDYQTGWQQDAHQNVSFSAPDDWRAGRIWGRRDCDFSNGAPAPSQCVSGGCHGGLQCDPDTGTGVPPVTLAEFTLGANGEDFYDVSLIQGFNLPMEITNSEPQCGVASCPVDLNPRCTCHFSAHRARTCSLNYFG